MKVKTYSRDLSGSPDDRRARCVERQLILKLESIMARMGVSPVEVKREALDGIFGEQGDPKTAEEKNWKQS